MGKKDTQDFKARVCVWDVTVPMAIQSLTESESCMCDIFSYVTIAFVES